METKEKSRPAAPEQNAAPRRKRPSTERPVRRPEGAAAGEAPRRRAREPEQAARRPRPRQEAQETVTAQQAAQNPQQAEATQAVRNPQREAPRRPKQKRQAPQKRSLFGAKKPKQPAERTYQPYQRANSRRKSRRNRNIVQNVVKFFSYENPVLKLFSKPEPDVFGDSNATRMELLKEQEKRRRKRAAQLNTPAIIYTQPASFNRSRLAVQLLTVLAVVLALVLGMSVFFKVRVITVSGAKVYSAWTVRESSGIVEGENLLTFGRTKASGQIIANLPYVKSARIGIKLPDTVNIEIEEEDVVYAIQDQDGVWWLINSTGKVVEQTSASKAKDYTKVLGITITSPQVAQQAVAKEEIPTETDENGELLPVTSSGSVQLNAALHILQALELNDIVGSAASVDVTRIEDIILWYGTQYQVNLGNTSRMDYKIACLNDVVLQMSDYQTGILDISFNNMGDMVVYTPFG